jgi:uncharacterized protein (DUF1778 family)
VARHLLGCSFDLYGRRLVLDSATATAERVLADRRYFAVSDEAWHAFEAALERPAVFKPRLHDLLTEDSPFEPRT